jgi:hypothetical protein
MPIILQAEHTRLLFHYSRARPSMKTNLEEITMASGSRIYSGSYTGTGAALEINMVPFTPKVIQFYQTADYANSTAIAQKSVKTDAMPTDMFFDLKGDAIVFAGQGVTITGDGFDLGTSALVNDASKRYLFVAWG